MINEIAAAGDAVLAVITGLGVAVVLLAAFLVASRRTLAALRADHEAQTRASRNAELHIREQDTRLAERETRLMQAEDARATLAQALHETEAALIQAERRSASLGEQVNAGDATRRDLRERLEAAERRLEGLGAEHARLSQDHAALRADHAGRMKEAEERLAEMKEMREKMRAEFSELAQATLRRTGEDFSKSHLERLTGLLTPFREHVGHLEKELRQVHKSADEERARLSEQIRLLSTRSEEISAEAVALTRALKGDSQRQGAWGEMILERILEESGLIEGTHYERQASRTDEQGVRWRPDVIVRMPREKLLVVDSKVSLTAYETLVSAEDDATRALALRDHLASLRRHIDGLASKGYGLMEEGSVDYVLMFVPIEGALSEALRAQPDLGTNAVGKGVGLVTPTTLMLSLRTVQHIWDVERRDANAGEIAKRAGLLHDKLVGFTEDMTKVDRALSGARGAFEDAMGKLSRGSGNLVGQADKLRKLGARAGKTIAIPFDEEDDDALPPPDESD